MLSAGLYPASGKFVGFFTCVIVSPTCVSFIDFIPVIIYPTDPTVSSFTSFILGEKIPTSSMSNSLSVDIIFILSPLASFPSTILM